MYNMKMWAWFIIYIAYPSVTISPAGPLIRALGGNVTYTCDAQGRPRPDLSWYIGSAGPLTSASSTGRIQVEYRQYRQ